VLWPGTVEVHLLTDEEAVVLPLGSYEAELPSFVLQQAIPPSEVINKADVYLRRRSGHLCSIHEEHQHGFRASGKSDQGLGRKRSDI
jgi:hypothetical protein